MKKSLGLLATAVCALTLASCNGSNPSENPGDNQVKEVTSTTLSVKNLGLSDDFIKGIDMSSLISLENAGVKFYDFDGNEADCLKTLAENGVNYIRVRVWNDPYNSEGKGYGGGNNDVDTAIKIGKRATKYGMKLLVNFHYSDFWADPAKQMVPKAWVGMNVEQKADAIYNFTKQSLQKMIDEGIDIGMIQVGNETNGFFCGERNWGDIADMFSAGSKACREVVPNAKVALHFANPEKVTNYNQYSYQLSVNHVDYDVFASSYYPYWHGTLDNLTTVLNTISDKYNKEVMVAETSYANYGSDTDFSGNTISDGSAVVKNYPYTVQGQTNCIVDVMEAVSKMKKGLGVFYWEGAWISVGGSSWEENSAKWEEFGAGWASSYAGEYDPNDAGKYYGGSAVDNQAFFDSTGHPYESLKLWALASKGNAVAVKADAIEDVTVMCDLAGEIILPSKVNAVMNNNTKREVSVTWDISDSKKTEMKAGGVQKYIINGVTDDGSKAVCTVSMIEFNYLTDYSFEDSEKNVSATAPWKLNNYGNCEELHVEEKSTDSLTGIKHYHYWGSNKNSVNFDIEQDVNNLTAGNYKASASIMGGDSGNYTCYLYVKVNGIEVARVNLSITSYGNWDTKTINSFAVSAGDVVTVGVHVECEGSGAGAWGKIDDILLNKLV